jgi:hypothetical protein
MVFGEWFVAVSWLEKNRRGGHITGERNADI